MKVEGYPQNFDTSFATILAPPTSTKYPNVQVQILEVSILLQEESSAVDEQEKICFVISPIGGEGTDIRHRANQVLRHVIEPAVKSFDYKAIRADAISTPGMITSQVIEHVLESSLVIADLTDHNPNVFYELAVRHLVRKPFIQLIDKNQNLPFDVAGARTIFFDLSLDGVAEAVDLIRAQIESLERDSSDLDTPISITADLISLGRMSNQDQSDVSQLLPLLTDINSAMHNYGREIRAVRADITRMDRRQRGLVERDEHNPFASRRQIVRRLELALRRIREFDPEIFEYGQAMLRPFLSADTDSAGKMLNELLEMLGNATSLPSEDKQRAMTNVANALGALSAELREEGQVEDSAF